VWAAIRRMAAGSGRTRTPKSPAGTCNAFTIEVRVEGPAHAASVTATCVRVEHRIPGGAADV
jgi:hypothetical protein